MDEHAVSSVRSRGGESRAPAAALGIAAALWLAASLTYREAVDGPPLTYAAGMTLSVLSSLLSLAWAVSRGVRAWVAAVLVVLVALPAPVVHGVRLARQGSTIETRLGWPPGYLAALEPTLKGEAALAPSLGDLSLRVPAGSVGYLTIRPPDRAGARWDLPRALFAPAPHGARARAMLGEEIEVEASVMRDNVYFILIETDRLMFQVTAWGLFVTSRGPAGEVTGESVPNVTSNGDWHRWVLRRRHGTITLSRDGAELWSGVDTGVFEFVRLGESRTDHEHGGVLRLRSLHYRRGLV